MASKKLTKNQQEYKRQMKRIRQALYRERKKGFDVREVAKVLLEKPARITQKFIEKLKDITPKVIRRKSNYVDYVPPKGTPIIEKPSTSEPKLSYTVNTDLGEMVETIDKYTGEVLDQQPVDYADWARARYDNHRKEQEQKAIEQTIEEEIPPAKQETSPYADAIGYTQQYIEGTAKEVITLYDDNGDMIAEIARINGGEFIDTATGELFDRNEVKNITANLNQYNANLFKETNTPVYNTTDLSDYAIEMLYNQTQILSDKTGGVLHKMFDEVREELGDGDFYNMLLESNGFRSAFGELSSMLKSGADYMQAFARFGASIVNAFPLNQQQREAINEAFTELVQQADEGDINS